MFLAKLAIKLLKTLNPTLIHCNDAFLDSLALAILPIKGIEGLANHIGLRWRRITSQRVAELAR